MIKISDYYDVIKPGTVIGTDNWNSVPSWPIRFTAGWRHAKNNGKKLVNAINHLFSRKVSSHVLMVAEQNNLLYGIEMNWPKIHRVDLIDIGRIIFMSHHRDIDEEFINQWLWDSHSKNIKYGLLELLEFWGIDLEVCDEKKWHCSEMVMLAYRANCISYPKYWNHKVSPYDIQKWITNQEFYIN